MPTTVFPLNDSAIIPGPGKGTAGGISHRFVVTGTKCEVNWRVYYGAAQNLKWTVDGGAIQTIGPVGVHAYSYETLFDGLSDAAHDVNCVLEGPNGDFDATTAVRVTGAAPALTAPDGFNNNIHTADSSGIVVDMKALQALGGWQALQPNGCMRFKATTSELRFIASNVNGGGALPEYSIAVVVDDDIESIQFSTLNNDDFAEFVWSDLFEGYDGTAEHEYRIFGNSHVGTFIASTMLSVGGTLNAASLTALDVTYYQGDSITQGIAIGNEKEFGSPPFYYGIISRRAVNIDGATGTGVLDRGVPHKADPGDATPTPTEVIYLWGMNDYLSQVLADWLVGIGQILTQVTADLPTAKIMWCDIIPIGNSGGSPPEPSSLRKDFSDGAETLVTTDWDDEGVIMGDLGPLYPVPGYLGDGQHPGPEQALRIARWQYSLITPATAYTADLSDVEVNAGTPVTITFVMDGGAVGVSVTPDSDLAGTFSDASPELFAGTVNEITFTPSAAGTHTISFTNDGSLDDPASLELVVVASGGGGDSGARMRRLLRP